MPKLLVFLILALISVGVAVAPAIPVPGQVSKVSFEHSHDIEHSHDSEEPHQHEAENQDQNASTHTHEILVLNTFSPAGLHSSVEYKIATYATHHSYFVSEERRPESLNLSSIFRPPIA